MISYVFFFFFFNDTATTEIYTLSLHDALPISRHQGLERRLLDRVLEPQPLAEAQPLGAQVQIQRLDFLAQRSEEHTSELQSRLHLVCRLLLEKKKNYITNKLLSEKQHHHTTRL